MFVNFNWFNFVDLCGITADEFSYEFIVISPGRRTHVTVRDPGVKAVKVMQVLEALNAEPVTFNLSRNDESELSEPRPQAVDMSHDCTTQSMRRIVHQAVGLLTILTSDKTVKRLFTTYSHYYLGSRPSEFGIVVA